MRRVLVIVYLIAAAGSADTTAEAQQPPKIAAPPQVVTNDVVLPPAARGPAQTLVNDVVLPPARKTTLTGPSCPTTLTCPTPFASPRDYIPSPVTPQKIVNVQFDVIQKSDGSGNWQNTPADVAALNQLVTLANNNYYAMYLCVPSDPCPGVVYPTDAGLRLNLQRIVFIRDTSLYTSNNTNALLAVATALYPDSPQYINVFWTGGSFGSASAFALTPSDDRAYDQAVVMLGNTTSAGDGSYFNWGTIGLLVHELGHVFGLLHTFTGGCCPENYLPGNCRNLDDVFCPTTNPFPQMTGWGCDPYQPSSVNTCTNNIMGGTRELCEFSADQLGVIHMSLSRSSAQKYVEPTACLQSPSGMTLWLPLDEFYGTTALNPPGTAGAYVGAAAVVAGKVSRARQFNGTPSQHLNVPNYAGINFANFDFTLEAWILPGTIAGKQIIVSKEATQSGVTRGYSFFINNGFLGLDMADGTTSTFLTSSAAVAAGSWAHVGVTVNRHSATGGVFYVNGAPVSTFDPRPRNHSITNTSPLRVACDALTGGSCYQGSVDEVVAYARALTASEMQAIFAAQGKGRCKQYCSTPTVAYAQTQTTIAVNGQICNASDVPRTFIYWLEGTPAATCAGDDPIDGPAMFSPCTNIVTIPAGTCTTVPAQVARPSGFNNSGTSICYHLAVQSLGNNDVLNFRCSAMLLDFYSGPPRH
jgi:hypothetical protein